MADLNKLAEEIVGLTLLQAQELKTILKDKYGIEPAAGGDEFHNGGRQFTSQDDPQFKTIAAWVRGQTAGGGGR